MEFTKPERFALPASLVLTGLILLTGLMPGDPKPGKPIQAIYRYEMKRRESWNSEEGRLRIPPDSLSQDDKEWYTFYFSGNSGLTRAAIEECESLLQLLVLVEKNPLKNPEAYEDFTEIMQCFEKLLPIVIKIENYQEWTLFIERINILLPIPFVLMPFILKPFVLMLFVEVKRCKSLSSEGGRLMLRISDSLSRDERDQFTSYLNGGDSPLPVAAIEECKSLLQLFVLLEKFALNGPGELEYITQIMQFIENIVIFRDKENYGESQQSSTITNEGHMIGPAQTAAVIPYPSTVAELMPDLPKYKMDRLPRGLCIIFNAENFTIKKLRKRDGTEKDVEALLNTFQNRLKFKTRVEQDPTADKYLKCLQQIARSDHSEYDCFVCIILSHGSKGHVYGTDGRLMAIDALTGLFRGEYVPSLVNKPKLFFIQACQGNNAQGAVDIQQDATATLPNESDTLVSMSTVSGYASNRSVSQGTWFISSLCMVINSYYKNKVDLLSMLTIVNEQLSKAADKEKGKQIGNPSHTLRKQIFFNQGLGE